MMYNCKQATLATEPSRGVAYAVEGNQCVTAFGDAVEGIEPEHGILPSEIEVAILFNSSELSMGWIGPTEKPYPQPEKTQNLKCRAIRFDAKS